MRVNPDVAPAPTLPYIPPKTGSVGPGYGPYSSLTMQRPMMMGGIGGLFNRLRGMDDETFNRGMERYGQFQERFGGGFQPNMFGSFAGMDDEGFNRGMERLSSYAERFGGNNPMFRNFRMPTPDNASDVIDPNSPGGDGAPINPPVPGYGNAEPVTGGQTPYPVDGPGAATDYNPNYNFMPMGGPPTRPYYNTGFGSANPYMPRNPYAGGYGMGYNSYSGGQSPFGRSSGGKGGGNPYMGRPAGGGSKGGSRGINPGGMYG